MLNCVNRHIGRILAFAVLSFHVQTTVSQNSSLNGLLLDTVTVLAGNGRLVDGHLSGRLDVTSAEMERAPKMLGFADPIRYLQTFPGVQTTSELQGGLFVDGTGSSHTMVLLNGAPVYNPSHLLGIFSTFNTLHLGEMNFSKHSSGTAARLGGTVELKSDTSQTERVELTADAGMIGSLASLKIPVCGNSTVLLSARAIYFNFLADRFLTKYWDGNSLNYSFNDMNFTWITRLDSGDVLQADFFSGSDLAGFNVTNNSLVMDMDWHNAVFSAKWEHDMENGRLEQSLAGSLYHSRFNFGFFDRNLSLAAGISDLSYRLDGRRFLTGGMVRYGMRLSHYGFVEQKPELAYTQRRSYNLKKDIFADDACASVMVDWFVSKNNTLELSLTGNVFESANGSRKHVGVYASADPSVSLTHTFNRSGNSLSLRAGTDHQYLHLCGFTTNGMPTEFWLPSSGTVSPESAFSVSLNYERDFLDGNLNFQSEVYYKSLRRTVEFRNSFMDAVNEGYSLYDGVIQGDGYAFGANIMMGSDRGTVNWLVSYSYGHSRTRLDGYDGYSPNYFERPHDLKIRLDWDIDSQWRIGADGLFCSGTPFTMPEFIYTINETVIVEYGKHNGARMPSNWRVDLSAGWTLKSTADVDCAVDFSLYNAFFAHNVLYYFYHKRVGSDNYIMKRFIPIPACIPSVSLRLRF